MRDSEKEPNNVGNEKLNKSNKMSLESLTFMLLQVEERISGPEEKIRNYFLSRT
jgi:hypothetical protein